MGNLCSSPSAAGRAPATGFTRSSVRQYKDPDETGELTAAGRALDAQLRTLTVRKLKSRAAKAGIAQGQVESVEDGHDPKDALVGMILAHYDSEQAVLASVRSELEAMLPREIEARATEMGITAESLDEAKDQNDVKEALIRIVTAHLSLGRVRRNSPGVRAVAHGISDGACPGPGHRQRVVSAPTAGGATAGSGGGERATTAGLQYRPPSSLLGHWHVRGYVGDQSAVTGVTAQAGAIPQEEEKENEYLEVSSARDGKLKVDIRRMGGQTQQWTVENIRWIPRDPRAASGGLYGQASIGVLSFDQVYQPKRNCTHWLANLSRDGRRLIDGTWHGACEGTFSADRIITGAVTEHAFEQSRRDSGARAVTRGSSDGADLGHRRRVVLAPIASSGGGGHAATSGMQHRPPSSLLGLWHVRGHVGRGSAVTGVGARAGASSHEEENECLEVFLARDGKLKVNIKAIGNKPQRWTVENIRWTPRSDHVNIGHYGQRSIGFLSFEQVYQPEKEKDRTYWHANLSGDGRFLDGTWRGTCEGAFNADLIQPDTHEDDGIGHGLRSGTQTTAVAPAVSPSYPINGQRRMVKRNHQRGALRGGRGEFYGGNQILITDAEGRQATNQNYTPFEGAGATTATEGATGLDSDGGGRRRGRPWAVS